VSASQSVMFSNPAELPPNALLTAYHYLGPIDRGEVYRDTFGLLIFANPSSRHLPSDRWLELVRWCIVDQPGAGSRGWAQARRWLLETYPLVSTVVSYSDPSVGHTGALYRACNWLWAPTWQRLRPPPTGNGDWGTGAQAVKDRWIAVLRPDAERESLLTVKDEAIVRRMPWATYQEPRWHGLRARGGGADYKRWLSEAKA
jgi:hypothetical protein